jgi:hypothetical protein
LAKDFQEGGPQAIAKVRKQQPAAYMKICALLVPKEFKVERTGGVKDLTDEELDQAIAAVKAMIAARTGETAKVIEGEAEVVPSLPAWKPWRFAGSHASVGQQGVPAIHGPSLGEVRR